MDSGVLYLALLDYDLIPLYRKISIEQTAGLRFSEIRKSMNMGQLFWSSKLSPSSCIREFFSDCKVCL